MKTILIIKNNDYIRAFEIIKGKLHKFDFDCLKLNALNNGDFCLGTIKKIGTHYSFLNCSEKDVFINNNEIQKKYLPIKIGSQLIVQIGKEDVMEKRAKATTFYSLKGSLCSVYHELTSFKVEEQYENIAKKVLPFKLKVHAVATEKKILKEAIMLSNNLNKILEELNNGASVFKNGVLEKLILTNPSNTKFITNSKETMKKAKSFSRILGKKVQFKHASFNSICVNFKMLQMLEEITKTQVNLQNGGFFVINKTEALTSFDINSAKTNKANFDKVNLEAVFEIARHILIKNISGIIIIDFINNNFPRDVFKKIVKKQFEKDSQITKIDFIKDSLLVAIVRKCEGKDIMGQFLKRCITCDGSGFSSVCIHIEKIELEVLSLIASEKKPKNIVINFTNKQTMIDFLNRKKDTLKKCFDGDINVTFKIHSEENSATLVD